MRDTFITTRPIATKNMNNPLPRALDSLRLAGAITLAAFASAATAGGDFTSAPIVTRPATTAQNLSVIANAKYFNDVDLEEADQFDGYGVDAEVIYPLTSTIQVRLILPLYTKGEARLLDPPTHETIDIDGTGGTFEFPGFLFDHQLLKEADSGFNLAWFLGAGKVVPPDWGILDASHGDRFNHQGKQYRLGLKADGSFSGGRWLANAGVRSYQGSDDMNPARDGDSFVHYELMGALLFDRSSSRYTPGVEMIYTGDGSKYNSVLVIPQVILPIDNRLALKVGVPLGLTSDGERWGLRVQLSY